MLWFGMAPTPVDRVAHGRVAAWPRGRVAAWPRGRVAATAWFAKAAAKGLPDAVNNLTGARKQQAGSC